ncbi:UpxY family transcription antiterminator [Chitinophaga qingshengii]|uniref:UpxY family transcription antiterminator n=1 Tax=Chitinophaga qingshengii TaxID=1569794 RepID=A0ABR7TTV4_9BACT|nr:UpxY family transcription antiterminator [Chitinophaga qingshengii]MBC9932834.1 UpxY family transcription antiterminator [Chitinophaga qingshengii]
MSDPVIGWYVVYTKPRHEKKVAAFLSASNIVNFLPIARVLRVWKDRKKYIDAPLFPSYLFIYLEDLETYYRVLSLEAVLYYVRTGKEVVKVKEEVIHSIQLITQQTSDIAIEVSDDYFQPGKQLMIKDGILCGLACEVVEVKGQQKILVRVNMLQKNILVAVSSEYFESIAV